MASGVLPDRIWTSPQVLVTGFGTGVVLDGILTVPAITTRLGTDLLETMMAMLNALSAISTWASAAWCSAWRLAAVARDGKSLRAGTNWISQSSLPARQSSS
jgi:hypothetical protein